MPAETDGGKEGYIYTDDLDPAVASAPEEAVAQTKSRMNSSGDIIVPVYAEDGTTKIGDFTAGHVTIESAAP